MFRRILQNHVLANIAFLFVMAMGISAYLTMPREQNPTINFNWIDITTVFPGASTPDVEKQITNVLEDAIRNVSDIDFVSSTSREGISSILVRFNDISTRVFDKRIADLRREVEGIEDELPGAALDPFIFEVTTDNAFPTATVVISSPADDENLRRQATLVQQDIAQLKGVGKILANGLTDPEIHVVFNAASLERYGISPVELSTTINAYYQNVSAGTIDVAKSNWAVKITGSRYDLEYIRRIPVLTAQGEVELRFLAEIIQAKEPARELVRFNGQPAVLLAITKQEKQNILELVERIGQFIQGRESSYRANGVSVSLVDDQTQITRDALYIMQRSAMIGLGLVFVVTWLFLGIKISALTGLAIPFILAGTFWFLHGIDQTLNVTVLLGIVISLGMLVDDAVVVVESIYYRLQRGAQTLDAALDGLREVIAPVTTSVLTTMSAFLPLMLLPGILGKFMLVLPVVVTSALAISLVEAYWLLPAHIVAMKVNFRKPGRLEILRRRCQSKIRGLYLKLLLKVLRRPLLSMAALLCIFAGAGWVVLSEKIKFDFFASDPIRLFYVNTVMPAGTELSATMDKILEIESVVRKHIEEDESRSIVSYAGQLITQTEPFFGDQYGQILVSLKPRTAYNRSVDEIIDGMSAGVQDIPGVKQVSFLKIAGGPPVARDISVKVRGDDIDEIIAATAQLKAFMSARAEFKEVADNNLPGQNTMDLSIRSAAVQRTGISPQLIARTLRLLVDGEVVSDFRHLGEKISIRLRADNTLQSIDQLLEYRLPAKDGAQVALSQLVEPAFRVSPNSIRHYNYRRTIAIEADIDKAITDTVKANKLIREHWQTLVARYPNVDLDFSGLLDNVQESLEAIGFLAMMGLGLIYLILGTQFRSYFQPLLVISTVPMAATGVIFGVYISGFAMSLYTIYGVVALAGIAVNAAIVLISTANARLKSGMSVTKAIIYASRRRVIPILITSLTTIAGLLSLATGLGGESLLWGPMAASMVWGLTVSTLLTLFFIPLLYGFFMRRHRRIGAGDEHLDASSY